MRVGFIVTHREQAERFEAVLRRTPGARFLVPAGRWPSFHHDPRQEVLQWLVRHGLFPVIRPSADFDLVITAGEIPEASTRSWLRPHGTIIGWRDPSVVPLPSRPSLVLCSGPALRPAEGNRPWAVVGDPLLDAAREPGARFRARAALGLPSRSERRMLLLHFERDPAGLGGLVEDLARWRGEVDLVVTASTRVRLGSPTPLPRCLSGPGVYRPGDSIPHADLLAAADLVLAEPGPLLVEAAALGCPAYGLGSWNRPSRRSGAVEDPLDRILGGWQWIDDGEQLRKVIAAHPHQWREWSEAIRPVAETLLGPADGRSVQRMVECLRLLGPPQGAEADPAGTTLRE